MLFNTLHRKVCISIRKSDFFQPIFLFFEVFAPNPGRFLYHSCTRTLGVIPFRPWFPVWILPAFFRTIPTNRHTAGAVPLLEFGQFLHQSVIRRLALTVFPSMAHFSSPASRNMPQAAPVSRIRPMPPPKEADMQGLFTGETIQIGKSRHYGLGAVISFLEQGNGLCHPVLFP